jgi:hypothetical protein
MRMPADIRRHNIRKTTPNDSVSDPTEIIPFGRGGVGSLTGHPVGLVVVLGLFLMALLGLPESRWFLIGTLLLGGIFGFFLWLRHR